MAAPILLVADDLSLIAAVKRVLAREGRECVLATSAADAVIGFGHELPGLVLLQPSVESDRGQVVLEELQHHPDAQLLKVVLLGETIPGFPWPVEPLPIDPGHFALTVDENVRAAESPAAWSVLETAPHLGSPDIEPGPAPRDDWRATPPAETTSDEPRPRRPSTPSGLALESRLFGDLPSLEDELHRDVEAEALASVESTLAQDEELTRLEEDVRAEAQRRRQAREAIGARITVDSSPTPVPVPGAATVTPPKRITRSPALENSFATLSDEDDAPSAPNGGDTPSAAQHGSDPASETQSGGAAATVAQSVDDTASLSQRTVDPAPSAGEAASLASDLGSAGSSPSRAPLASALSRAEQMLHEARAVADAQVRVDEADARQRSAELEAINRRAEHAESLVRREREVRAALEEDLERLRAAATAHEQTALSERANAEAERRAFDDERARAAAALEALHQQADSRLDEREATLTAQLVAAQRQSEALARELDRRQDEVAALTGQLQAREEALAELGRRRDEKIAELTRAREERFAELTRQQGESISSLTRRHDEKVAELERQLSDALEAAQQAALHATSASAAGAALDEEQRAHLATRAAANTASEAAALALATEQQAHQATRAAGAAALDAEHRAHQATRDEATAALEEATAKLEQEQRAHQATRDDANAALDAEQRGHRETQEALVAAEARVGAAASESAELEQQAHQATRAALLAAEARLDAVQAEQGRVEDARARAEAERDETARRMVALEGELMTLTAALDAAGLERQRLEDEAQSAQADSRAALARVEAEKTGVQDELERTTQRLAVATKELAVARDALDTVRSRAEEAEATATLASEKVRELESKSVMPLALPGRRALGVARHGTVTLEGVAQLVCQLVISSADQRVELGAAGGTRTLWLKKGQIVAASSTFEAESLIDRARRDGLIDARQESELRLLRTATLREQLEALKRRGFIRDIESVPLVQRCAEQIALAALSEDSSQYRLADEGVPPEVLPVTVPRPTLPLLAEALRRAVPVEALLEQLGGGEAVPAATDADFDLRALGFSDRERKMLAWVDGEATVEDLSLASGLKPDAAFRALLVAKLLGVLTVTLPAHPRVAIDAELDVRRLEAKYDEVQDADYFTILGLPRAASADDVQRAWQRLSTEFHPLRFSGHPDAGLQQRAQVVYGLLEEAMRALEDDRRRTEYARHLLD